MVEPTRPPIILKNMVRNQLTGKVSGALDVVSSAIRKRYGKSVLAIAFYGSCLRSSNPFEGILDLYVVVKDYKSCYKRLLPAVSNLLLPPNVFYLEEEYMGKTVRVKYAIVSMKQLERATSCQWFHSYFWARFCQPMVLTFYRDEDVLERMVRCTCNALFTFSVRVIPCLEKVFSVKRLWQRGLELTYKAELRPEGRDRAITIWKSNKDYFEAVTPHVLRTIRHKRFRVERDEEDSLYHLLIMGKERFLLCRLSWALRIVWGKLLSILRLIKACFTFGGGVDYALWKIERHTGVRIRLGPFLRRHPLLAMFFASWRLLRRKAIR